MKYRLALDKRNKDKFDLFLTVYLPSFSEKFKCLLKKRKENKSPQLFNTVFCCKTQFIHFYSTGVLFYDFMISS